MSRDIRNVFAFHLPPLQISAPRPIGRGTSRYFIAGDEGLLGEIVGVNWRAERMRKIKVMRKEEWSVQQGASMLIGVEKTAWQLIAEMDKRLADRGNDGKVAPETKGIAVVCIMTCAFFCELALKTLHASLSGGIRLKEHDLEKLYDTVEESYAAVHPEDPDRLEHDILNEMKAYYANIPRE